MTDLNRNLHELSDAELGRLFPIELVPYDTNWPLHFERKRVELLKLLKSDALRIEHFGSTAVPGLSAKPAIDILVAIPEDAEIADRVRFKMAAVGYECIYRTDSPPPYWMFVQGYTPEGYQGQCFHVHVAPESHRGLWDRLFFRDYLKKHPEVANAYGSLKEELAVKYRFDREGYTEAKADFVKRVTEKALAQL